MTSGFGVDPAEDGTSGTSSEDIRKIFGGLYTAGVISGCLITTSASAMTYSVSAGVVAIKTAVGEIILAPVAATTIATSAAPGSGSRTDIIYAQQRYPSIEGDANIVISVGTTLPARAVELRRYIISAGNTNTNAGVVSGGVNFSIPYGATLGVLHQYQHQYHGQLATGLERRGHGTITLPTDRRVKFSIQSTLTAFQAVGFDNSKFCEYGFLPNIDGGDFVIWTTTGLSQAWTTFQFEGYLNLSAGQHTVNYGGVRTMGPGTPHLIYGSQLGYGRTGTIFTVEDAGPTV